MAGSEQPQCTGMQGTGCDKAVPSGPLGLAQIQPSLELRPSWEAAPSKSPPTHPFCALCMTSSSQVSLVSLLHYCLGEPGSDS